MPRVVQRGRQESDVVWFLNRVVEVQSVRVRGRDDCEQNHVAIHTVSKHIIYMADYNPPPPFLSSPRPFNHQIKESAAAKAYDAEWKWMTTSTEAKKLSDAAKAKALSDFKKRFPHAQMSRFQVQVEIDANRKASGEVQFPDGNGSWELIGDQKHWSPALRAALGVQQDGGFPYQLSPNPPNKPLSVPTIDFSAPTGQSVADLFNKELKIYVSPTDYFTTKFRKIFKTPKIKVTSSKYARPWIKGPNMGFWQQQLNFAVWCATSGCGVSREMLFDNSTLQLSEQVRTFYQFHVYYTTRKILYEMGGIQSKNALPDSPVFSEIKNPYDVASYKRICAEFNVDPSTDFRYTRGKNGGLGTVYIGATGLGDITTDYHYPDPDLALFNDERITDRNNSNYKANGISFIRNDQGADKQLEHFVPDHTNGLTPTGLGRINRSIEAFGYCILGAQANTRSSILGTLGTARNTQTDFLVLVDDAIRTLTVSNEPVKYQNAIEATKVRLNFAVARGVLLLPARMIINTESIVGYNNNLRRATDGMKLGVNNQVNQGTKKASLKLMEGGPSKINPPNSHPSNPIHKQATEAQGIAKPKPATPVTPTPKPVQPVTQPAPKPETVDTHHANKVVVAVGALALVGLIIYAAS